MEALEDPYVMFKNRLYSVLLYEMGMDISKDNHYAWTLAERLISRIRWCIKTQPFDKHRDLILSLVGQVFVMEYGELHKGSGLYDSNDHEWSLKDQTVWSLKMCHIVNRELGMNMRSEYIWLE